MSSLPLMLILIGLDQFSKSYFHLFLKNKINMTYKVTSFLSIVHAWNYGISFGLFSEYFHYSNYAFLIINCLIVGYLIAVHNASDSGIQRVGICFIVGGAVGNLIDRILKGAVFDFIHLHYKEYNFPAFNVADAFINIGVAILIIYLFLSPKRNP